MADYCREAGRWLFPWQLWQRWRPPPAWRRSEPVLLRLALAGPARRRAQAPPSQWKRALAQQPAPAVALQQPLPLPLPLPRPAQQLPLPPPRKTGSTAPA
jgi:hypothetical protein